jgi:carbon-monoxide dehydrogenase large subunit
MEQQIIGASVKRLEDPRLLQGLGKYVGDVRLHGMLHAAVLRSPHGHAQLRQIDASPARKLPGVAAVFTAADLGPVGKIPVRLGPRPSLVACLQSPLATETVRYVGEPVALVVATSRYLAEDALDHIAVQYEPLPCVTNALRAMEAGAPVLHPVIGTNVVEHFTMQKGDAAAAMAAAPVRIKETFALNRHSGVPLETRGLLADFDPGTRVLTAWGPSKVPHFNRQVLAKLLDYPEHLIHFLEPDVGGGFGVRGEFYPEDFLIPWAALRLARPIHWIEDRREHLMATNHSRQQHHEVEIGVERDGTMLALTDRITVDLGGYIRTHGVIVPELTAALLHGPYKIPNYHCDVFCVLTNKTPTGTYRSPGRFECNFVRERMVDLVAGRLGLDPAEVRRRNFIPPEAMPYAPGTGTLGQQTVYDSGKYASAFDAALEAADYKTIRAEQTRARREGRLMGIGLGCFVEKAGLGPWEMAKVEVDETGRVVAYTGLASVGQGMETAIAQICAQVLGVRYDEITVVHGDTARVPFGVGGFASRGTVVGGCAAYEAARKVKTRMLDLASRLLEARPDDLVMEGGRVFVKGASARALTFKDLALAAGPGQPGCDPGAPGLHASHVFEAPKMCYPYGTHVAVTEVDPATGHVALRTYALAYDVGKAINPMTIEGQLVGGLAQGIGGALFEEFVYAEEGQILTTTFMDYLMPTSAEMPERTIPKILEEAPSPLNPLGVKGAGEGGTAGASAAIANAVADALAPLGVNVTRLPLTPERIVQLITAQGGNALSCGNSEVR